MNSALTIKFGGEAGFGIMSAGLMLSKLGTISGYYIFDYTEYPSLIRGGHNMMQVSISTKPIHAHYNTTDILIALNQETIDKHLASLNPEGILIYDADAIRKAPKFKTCIALPLITNVKKLHGSMIMRNTIAMGALTALGCGDLQIVKDLILKELGAKNEEILNTNIKACELGYELIHADYKNLISDFLKVQPQHKHKHIVITGNEAIAYGAIHAGMQFAAIYPMTPTSNILHSLAPLQDKYNFIYKQPEDEISAINMAIGASFAGARSMVATSGGGFCLMTEGYGLAGITETPLVIIEGMRGAPATGLPTWTEQGDLQFVLRAHQGDFPRIVLAAGDTEEAFELSTLAFNLADKYQTPIVLLVDKYLCESHKSIPAPIHTDYEIDRGNFSTKQFKNYKRYQAESNGISLRSVPGSGNRFIANSDEHNEEGFSTEDISVRNMQMEKRMQKLLTCEQLDMEPPTVYGPANATKTIVSWGSNKGAIIEALTSLPDTNFIHLKWINPFPKEAFLKLIEKSKVLINIECNYSLQMQGWLREQTGINIVNNINKYDGRPFSPEEIIEKVKNI